MSTLRHLRLKGETCHWKAKNLFDLQIMQVQDFWFLRSISPTAIFFYYTGMPRKNWMISDLILPPEKVSILFPSIKSDCLKYLQQCLIRINSYSQSSLSKKKKELGFCDLTSTWMVSLLGGTSMWLSVNLQTNWNWLRRNSAVLGIPFHFVWQHLIWSPSCGLPVIRCSSNSLPSTALTYCCFNRGVHLCFIDWPIISIH